MREKVRKDGFFEEYLSSNNISIRVIPSEKLMISLATISCHADLTTFLKDPVPGLKVLRDLRCGFVRRSSNMTLIGLDRVKN
ncbi:hypothetical protein Krac_6525 [Ktedonobacter racemifer DSM 44963]|uniref:Uncharacterized protein n=1 Tax=Ktedonobacter racemifer DSM 44963 TaxID=485913 RepID=D6TV06_KTERA|nr:hypothetical protein Krac_6525 [Ktedonobacter racemifer DSM 44963]